jgi:hypothetical protein
MPQNEHIELHRKRYLNDVISYPYVLVLSNNSGNKAFLIQKSTSALKLRRNVTLSSFQAFVWALELSSSQGFGFYVIGYIPRGFILRVPPVDGQSYTLTLDCRAIH